MNARLLAVRRAAPWRTALVAVCVAGSSSRPLLPGSPQTHPTLLPASSQTHPTLLPASPQTHPTLLPRSTSSSFRW